jgi:hypothetical protein
MIKQKRLSIAGQLRASQLEEKVPLVLARIQAILAVVLAYTPGRGPAQPAPQLTTPIWE